MSDYIVDTINRYRRRGLLVDTNVFLLFLVGSYDKRMISEFKRTRDRFVPEDFDTMKRLMGLFDKVLSLPNILTEVSNLVGSLAEPKRAEVFRHLAAIIPKLVEEYVPSAAVTEREEYLRLGVTDAAIIAMAEGRFLVLTDDLGLYAALAQAGEAGLNFNHVRVAGWSAR